MSREIGTLVYFAGNAGKPAYYRGRIEVAGATGEIYLVPNRDKRTDAAPDYRLKLDTPDGFHEYGAAWVKETEAGDDYLSITVDAPTMRAPVYCAGFMLDLDEQPEKDKPDHWRIVWGRAKAKGRRPVSTDLGGDGVPY